LLAFGALTQKLVLLVPFHWAWGVELEWGERGFRVLSAIAVYFISGFLYNDQVDYLQLLRILSKKYLLPSGCAILLRSSLQINPK
jgi:hypothetical protein